jgi:hypothetical protein
MADLTFACGLGLKSETSKGNHGQTPILNFFGLGLLEVSLGEA